VNACLWCVNVRVTYRKTGRVRDSMNGRRYEREYVCVFVGVNEYVCGV